MVEIPEYQILSTLGQGGMGAVYRAQHKSSGQVVALKVLLPTEDDFLDRIRFQREFHMARQLSHPALVPVFEFGEAGERLYYTMELVSGVNLRSYLESKKGPNWLSLVGQIFDTLLSGLDYVHAQGVIHRDLKPQNILVDEHGTVRVLDFGLARQSGQSRLTQSGMVVGTPQYMSPEQLRGEALDARTDLYSVGVILYELIAGKLPFASDDPMQMVLDICTKDPAPPAFGASPELSQVILKLLARNREDRYGAAAEAAEALAAALPARERSSQSDNRVAQAHSLYEPQFVGRDAQLRALFDWLQPPYPRLAVVEGTAGLGRTRFLRQAAELLEKEGWQTISSQGLEYGGQPYHVLMPALKQAVKDGLPAELEGYRSALVLVLPELASGRLPHPAPKQHVFEALRALITYKPGALLIDDLQWADHASLEFLETFAGQPLQTPFLVLATCNLESWAPGEAANPQTLLDSWRQRGALFLALEPLSGPHFDKMVKTMLGYGSVQPTVLEQLAKDTGGNPMFLAETLKTMAAQGRIRLSKGEWRFDMDGLSVTAGRRLEGLDPEDLRIAQYVALLGQTSLATLSSLYAGNEADLLERLERLRKRRILTELPGGQLDFECRIVAQAVRGTLEAEESPILHARLAEVLERLGAGPERLALHWQNAMEYTRAARHLATAAYFEVQACAGLRAAYLFQQALLLDPSLREELEEPLGDAYMAAGEPARAQSIYEALLQRHRSSPDRLRWLNKLATCHQDQGRLYEAEQLLLEALENEGVRMPSRSWLGRVIPGGKSSPELTPLLMRLQRILFYLRPPGWEADTAEILHRTATPELAKGVRRLLTPKRNLLKARAHFLTALTAVQAEPESPQQAAMLEELGFFLLSTGDFRGRGVMLEGMEKARRVGALQSLTVDSCLLALFEAFQGWIDRARALLDGIGYSRNQNDLDFWHATDCIVRALAGDKKTALQSVSGVKTQYGFPAFLARYGEVLASTSADKARAMLQEDWARLPINRHFALHLALFCLRHHYEERELLRVRKESAGIFPGVEALTHVLEAEHKPPQEARQAYRAALVLTDQSPLPGPEIEALQGLAKLDAGDAPRWLARARQRRSESFRQESQDSGPNHKSG